MLWVGAGRMNDDWGCIGLWNKNFTYAVVLVEGQLENMYLQCVRWSYCRPVSLHLNNDGPLKTVLVHKPTPVSYGPFHCDVYGVLIYPWGVCAELPGKGNF